MRNKPDKPRRDFPLFAHSNGQWAKKVLGKLHYFGVWEAPVSAEQRWDSEKADLLAGKTPDNMSRHDPNSLTVKELCNDFMASQELRKDRGAIAERQFNDYLRAVRLIADVMGRSTNVKSIGPREFRSVAVVLARSYKAPGSLRREMTNCRAVFNWAVRNARVDYIIQFGDDFRPPGSTEIRRYRQKQKVADGPKEFTADQCRLLLEAATPTVKAMILLGLNAGFGNGDIRLLSKSHIDLDSGWVNYPRPKTAVDRVAKLWPETISQLNQLPARPRTAETKDLVFVNRLGNSFGIGKNHRPISVAFNKLLNRKKIYRPGLSFYTLRHTYRTQADSVRDDPAVNLTMGHVDPTMGANYRQHISPERLESVAAHVREWLFR